MSFPRALAILVAIGFALPCATAQASSSPVRFAVEFAYDARLGEVTPMTIDLHLDPVLAPLKEFRLLTPAGISLSDSQLGAAACERPMVEIMRVMGPVEHERCPGNSLMGTGIATAGLLLEDRTIFGAAKIALHAGATVADKPGLLVTADAYNPARIQLTYAGYLYIPPTSFGVGLAIMIPAIPHPPFGADVALSTLSLTVGASSITYHRSVRGRRTAYHPGGIPLPSSCPPGGFRFRAILRFADDTRRQADSFAPCPLANVS